MSGLRLPALEYPLGKVVFAGVLGGALSGLFGVGGGIVMVPLFVLFLGLDQRTAVTTSLLAIIPISVMGLLGYANGDAVAWQQGVILGVGSIVGGQIGVRALHRVPVPVLQLGFAALLVYSAYRMVLPETHAESAGGNDPLWLMLLVGLVAGLLAGLLGIGGGIVIVPALVILAGLDLTTARGTSLLVVLFTAVTASVTSVRAGKTSTAVGLWAGLAGAPAALLAAMAAQWIPQQIAAVLFACLMLVAAAQLARKALKRQPAD